MHQPLVSIVIVAYNSGDYIEACLDSVLKVRYPQFEVIIIDGGSTDDTAKKVKSRVETNPDRVLFIRNKNAGVSADRNTGIRASRGEYILLLDADTVIEADSLGLLVELMESNPKIAIAQPKIMLMDTWRICNAGTRMDRYGWTFSSGTGENKRNYDEPRKLVCADTTAMLLRRSIIEEVGLFDEYFFYHFEATDFSYRVVLNDNEIMYWPKAVVFHKSGHVRKTKPLDWRMRSFDQYHLTFILKNYQMKDVLRYGYPVLVATIISSFYFFLIRKAQVGLSVLTSVLFVLRDFKAIWTAHQLVAQRIRHIKEQEIAPLFAQPLWNLALRDLRSLAQSKAVSLKKPDQKNRLHFVSRIGFLIKEPNLRVSVLLILFSLLYTISAYRGDGLTIGGDELIPFHAADYLTRFSYPTNPWAGFGSELPPIFSLPPVPQILIFSLFGAFGADIYFANKLYFLLVATSSAFAMYFLGATLFSNNKHGRLIGVVASISYLYNPLVMADTYKSMVFSQLSLAQSGFILFLAFTVKYFRTKRVSYAFLSGCASFLFLSTPGLGAYQYIVFALAGYFCVFLYAVFKSRREMQTLLRGLVITFGLSFLINSYWLIPYLFNLNHYVALAANFQTTVAFNDASIMLNTLRLMNAWSFIDYAPYSAFYFSNPLIIAATFSWPLFAFFPLLFRETRRSPKILAIYVILTTTILIACGSNPPLGLLYVDIVNMHLGSFYLLKPFYTTGAVSRSVLPLAFAVLIGVFSSVVHSRLRRHFRIKAVSTAGVFVVLGILIASSWPVVTGEVMRNWYAPDQYGVRIPERYWEANAIVEKMNDLNHRMLLLPSTEIYVGTSWGFQGTSQFYNLMFNTPLITGNEVPYGITTNKTLVDRVYSVYYRTPDLNDTSDVTKSISEIVNWQNDKAVVIDSSLQIDLNSTYEVGEWHQIELRLPAQETWSNSTHMLFEFTGQLSLDRLQIGIGDAEGHVGWWSAQRSAFYSENRTLIPFEPESPNVQNNETIALLMELEKPDISSYSISNVTSVWIQYFVANSSDVTTLRVNSIKVDKMAIDDEYCANLWAENRIKYLLIDLTIQDGAKTDPDLWPDLLNNSAYFKLVWQKESLYIFENLTIQS